MGKLDITSSSLEKGLDIARDFLDKVVAPAAEEAGLLLRDTVALWKLKNQVRILTRARSYCEENGIAPSAISLKLLCPLLENAALEEDGALQDKWAILLSNLVDSEQNIQNHVFPYILGQLSSNEFEFLERVYADKQARVEAHTKELEQLRAERPSFERDLQRKIDQVALEIERLEEQDGSRFAPERWELQKRKRELEWELNAFDGKERALEYRIKAPQVLPEDSLREYELSNIVRLGLARGTQETYAHSQELEIPLDFDRDRRYVTVDVDVQLESEQAHEFTELGELFIRACTEKRRQA